MKLVLIIPFLLMTVFSFSQSKERVWQNLENAPVITPENAGDFMTHDDTFESAVNYFYASRIRKDRKWEEVIPAPEKRKERLQMQLERYATWTITQFHLVSISSVTLVKWNVKVYFKIEMDGKSEDGIDVLEIQLIDDKWLITSLPT